MSDTLKHILLVEDEEAHADLIRSAFESHNRRVTLKIVGNLKDARGQLSKAIPVLVITDLFLPDGKGTELLSENGNLPFPVVVMTCRGDEQTAVEAIKAGALDYVVKSDTCFSDLPHIAERALRQWEHIMERRRAEDAIRKAHDELEQRVQARTCELLKANERLQHEIEGRKRLERVLVQREKLNTLGAISAEVAHEIRNPLACIGGFAQRLKKKFPDLLECDIILSESQRLEKILSRIKDYLRPIDIHPHQCSVNTVITDCLNRISQETTQREVRCLLDLASRLPLVYMDTEILAQIFIDLIRNATDAMGKGGELIIRTFETDHDIHIEFKNQALAPKIKNPDILFMPFAEDEQGMSLPLCYRLLKDMGGVLSFTQENGYAIFTVSLSKETPTQSLSDQKTSQGAARNHVVAI